jgi:hypothetical protein
MVLVGRWLKFEVLLNYYLVIIFFRWYSPGTPVSSTNKTDRHDITEILLKVALNTIKQTYKQNIAKQNCELSIRFSFNCCAAIIRKLLLKLYKIFWQLARCCNYVYQSMFHMYGEIRFLSRLSFS